MYIGINLIIFFTTHMCIMLTYLPKSLTKNERGETRSKFRSLDFPTAICFFNTDMSLVHLHVHTRTKPKGLARFGPELFDRYHIWYHTV